MLEAIENSLLIQACKNNFGKADNVKVKHQSGRPVSLHVLGMQKTVVEEVTDDP